MFIFIKRPTLLALFLFLSQIAYSQLHIPTGSTITVKNTTLFTNDSISGAGSIDATVGTFALGSGASMALKSSTFTNNEVQELEIKSGATLEIQNNLALTVSQQLTLNGTIEVQSTGALIQSTGPTLSGSGNVLVNKVGFQTGGALQYNVFSSPITSASVTLLGIDKYSYNPANVTSTLAEGWVAETNGTMNPGQGYFTTNPGTIQFNGTPNNGTINYSAYDNSFGGAKIMNVIGNPYPSGLDLAAFTTANTALTGVYYFWDDNGNSGANYTNNGYATWSPASGGTWVQASNGGNKILNGHTQATVATCQGFIALPTTGNSAGAFTVTFNNAMRGSNSTVFFKTTPSPRFYINLLDDTTFLSQTAIVFDSAATNGFDERLDATRIANANSPTINAFVNGNDCAIAVYKNNPDSSLVIPINIWVPTEKTYKLYIPELQNIQDANLYWLNNSTGEVTQIQDSNSVHTEHLSQGLNNHLFIAVKPKQENNNTTSVSENAANQFDAVLVSNQLFVLNAPSNQSQLHLYTASGQLVKNTLFNQSCQLQNLAKGIYIAQIQSGSETIQKKFLIQ